AHGDQPGDEAAPEGTVHVESGLRGPFTPSPLSHTGERGSQKGRVRKGSARKGERTRNGKPRSNRTAGGVTFRWCHVRSLGTHRLGVSRSLPVPFAPPAAATLLGSLSPAGGWGEGDRHPRAALHRWQVCLLAKLWALQPGQSQSPSRRWGWGCGLRHSKQ